MNQDMLHLIWTVGMFIYPIIHIIIVKYNNGDLDYDGLTWIGVAIAWPVFALLWVFAGCLLGLFLICDASDNLKRKITPRRFDEKV